MLVWASKRTMACQAAHGASGTATVTIAAAVRRAWNEQRSAVLRGAFLAAEVRRRGKWLWQTLARPVAVEDLRPPSLSLVHDARVFEFFDESLFTSGDREPGQWLMNIYKLKGTLAYW